MQLLYCKWTLVWVICLLPITTLWEKLSLEDIIGLTKDESVLQRSLGEINVSTAWHTGARVSETNIWDGRTQEPG